MKNRCQVVKRVLYGVVAILFLLFACDDPLDTLRVFSLTIEIDGNGMVDPIGIVEVNNGEVLDILATPDTGYSFDGWEVIEGSGVTFGSQSEADTSVTLIDGDSIVSAQFIPIEYTLEVISGDNGIVFPDGYISVTHGVPTSEISALADEGYHFTRWIESGAVDFESGFSEASNPVKVVATGPGAMLEAVFVEQYTLTINTIDGGSTVPSGTVLLDYGESINIEGTPDSNYNWVGWSTTSGTGVSFGDDSAANTTVTLSQGDASIQANYSSSEINIKQSSMDIPSGGNYGFGEVTTGEPSDVSFTIENLGTADLLLTGTPTIDISGTDASQYSLISEPSTSVPPAGNTSFTLRFLPESIQSGITATISISNNDPDDGEDNYTFTVGGIGI